MIGAPAVVDVKLRVGHGAQSFPVVVSNTLSRGDTVEIGFSFGKLKRRHYQAIGDLMFGDAREIATFRENRRRPRGILHGMGTFFAWSFTGPPRAFRLLWWEWKDRRAALNASASDSGGGTAIATPVATLEPAPARAASA